MNTRHLIGAAVLGAALGAMGCSDSGDRAATVEGAAEANFAAATWGGAGQPPAQMVQNQAMSGQAQQPPVQQRQVAQLPPGVYRMQLAKMIDPNGFKQPMVAATAMIPVGWQANGGVVWQTGGMCGNGYTFDWRATSPDGAMVANVFPGMSWTWTNFSAGVSGTGCPTLQITSVQQYLQHLVRQSRPGARILDFRPRPDIQQSFKQLERVDAMPMGEMRTWVEAGEVLIGYNERGRELRESAAAVVIFFSSRMQGARPGETMDALTAQALPGFAFRAPDGQLDFKLAETIRTSIKLAPEWEKRINAHNNKIAQTNITEARKRAKITAQTYDEIRQMQQDSWEYRQKVQDRSAREFSETIRDVETYDDPMSPTGQIQLSSQYDSAYRLNDGTYVLTDDPSFNPYAVFGQDATKLEPTP